MKSDTIFRTRTARTELEGKGKRGSKVATTYAIEEGPLAPELVTTLRLFNVRGREVESIVLREPAEAQVVRSPWDGSPVSCRDCTGGQFYGVGRSLDYNNWVCAGCGRACSTLTESGMCR